MEVVAYSPDWIVQRFTAIMETPLTFTRTRYNGTTWSPWVRQPGATHTPYAMAAGIVSVPATGYATITLPAGRFTEAPVLTHSLIENANVGVSHVGQPTTTSFIARAYALGGAQMAAQVHWHAKQMTSSSASG